MNLRDSPDEAAFRAQVRAWLAENLPAETGPEWSRKMFDAGYAGLTWPEEYGGRGAPYSHQAIALEEFARAGAPNHMNVIALGMAGPTIMAHGTEEQKQRYLAEDAVRGGDLVPGILRARRRLRSFRRAHAHRAEGRRTSSSTARRCGRRSRTRPTSASSSAAATRSPQRHAGLTYVIVDMHAPGVEVRPLRQITGEAEFNEIFFTDVEVPRENLLGEIGGGWQVAMTTLLHERGTLGFALTGTLDAQVNRLIALTKERAADDPIIRDRVAQEWIELQALKLTNYRSLTTLIKTGIPGPEGSGSKLHWSEQNQRLTKLAMEILGGEDDGYWGYQQQRSRGNTIEAGTSEILRNIIAERVLGLPRSR